MVTAWGDALALVPRLRSIVGETHLRVDDGSLAAYSHDATPLFGHRPDVVVFPADAAQVSDVLSLASAHRVPVTPRGAGSSLAAGAVPLAGGIVLALSRMDRILEISPSELLAVCQPGVSTEALNAAVGRSGLLYPPDPGSHTVSTVGGNVATCAGGLRGLKYGVTRDWVLGVEAVLATGEVIRAGGRLTKDVAGYDLTRLLCGSEGTLAVITEITVRLTPTPPAAAYGLAYFTTLADAAEAVGRIIDAGLVPATLEFLDAVCIGAVEQHARLGLDTGAGALLLFGDDGPQAVVEESLRSMAKACEAEGATRVEVATTASASEDLLAARRCCLPALSRLGGITILEDVGVPRPKMPAMVESISRIAERHDVLCGTFGHAGDGNLHPTVVVDAGDDAAVARAAAAFEEIFTAAIAVGGTITGEHGVGAAKLPHLEAQLGAAHVALLRRLKAAFDPAGILNPGKVGS